MPRVYVLFESASGYALFKVKEMEVIAEKSEEFQKSVVNFSDFAKMVEVVGFSPFRSREDALDNCLAVSEGRMHEQLRAFLEMNLGEVKSRKKAKFSLGVAEDKLATSISDELSYPCQGGERIRELLRGVRVHFAKLIAGMKGDDVVKAQLGLGHAFSRATVKFNVNRVDNMIIQSIALLDQLDKDVNTFAMRVREWYSWHFPELVKLVNDNIMFSRVAYFIKNKKRLAEEHLDELENIVGDAGVASNILDAARASMGTDISEFDMLNICTFAKRVIELHEYRKQLYDYLLSKMHAVAPNLSALIGEMVGARLISHAGSLTNLAKYAASTVQILGAEKALFRALKTRGNTPKYGLIYHASFIGQASAKNKGRVSRYLANKCSVAARIDAFSDVPTKAYGEALRQQCQERLEFYQTGKAPRKNINVMSEVYETLQKEKKENEDESDDDDEEEEVQQSRKRRKTSKSSSAVEEEEDSGKSKSKKRKKSKKKRSKSSDLGDDEAGSAASVKSSKKDKKDKKKKKRKRSEI